MDIGHFDLNLLRTLDILLGERNVTRAAERLCVTQQAASGALRRLRQHFNDELLTRVGRNLELTPLAQSLIFPVRNSLIAAQAALNTRPSFDPLQTRMRCRISMSDYGLLVLLPGILNLLTVRAPNLQCFVEALSEQTFERLAMGDIDFCITADDVRLYGSHRPGRLICSRALFQDDFVCVVDPKQVDVSKGLSLNAYRNLRHNSVAFGNGIATIVEKAWAASTYEYDVAVTAPSFSALLFMLPGTPLIATAQRRLANVIAPRLGLSISECPLKIPRLRENLMWHERNDQNPAHEFLREIIMLAGVQLDAQAVPSYNARL